MAARKGRPPKPVEQKRAAGNPGKRTLPTQGEIVALPPAATLNLTPEPGRPLGRPGRTMWDRAWQYGHRWIAETDVEMLLMVCEQIDERAALRVRVLRDNDWRERAGLRALDAAIHDGLAALGFTPEARTRLSLGEVRVADAIQEYRAKAAGLAASMGDT